MSTNRSQQRRTYSNINKIKRKRPQHQISAKSRPNNQRYRQHKRREEVQQRLVHLLEDEDFGAEFPEPELPRREDVAQVVEHAVDEEEVPAVEALLENRHLAEPAAGAAAGEQDGAGGFGFDEDGAAHLDAAAELARGVAEEPVFGDGEPVALLAKMPTKKHQSLRYNIPRMSPESLDQKPRIPQRNRTMRERRTPNLTRQLPLQPTDLILQILRLLAHRAL